MRIDPHLPRQALRSAVALLETVRDPATVVVKGLPVMEIFNNSPLGEITCGRFLQDPSLVALAAERYPGEWPEPERLRTMPPGILGRLYQERFDRLGLHGLPALACTGEADDGTYLHQRRLTTHDVHDTVFAIPVTVAGEAAGAAYYASALNEFGPGAILSAWMFHAMEYPDESALIWKGVRFGLDIAE